MNNKYHYTYRIINKINKKEYIGVRTCSVYPKEDLGIKYFSSSLDKEFILDQKQNPEKFEYKIISIHPTRSSAINEEISLHAFFNIAKNEMYYNRSRQTTNGFDTTGKTLSKEHKEKISKFMSNRIVSEETKEKLRGKNNHMYGKRGEKSPHWGKKHSKERKEKIGNAHRNKIVSKETKEKFKGKNNPAAKHIQIYDSLDNLCYDIFGEFEKICKDNGLPSTSLKKSYQNNSRPILLTNNSIIQTLRNYSLEYVLYYKGWYAVII